MQSDKVAIVITYSIQYMHGDLSMLNYHGSSHRWFIAWVRTEQLPINDQCVLVNKIMPNSR